MSLPPASPAISSSSTTTGTTTRGESELDGQPSSLLDDIGTDATNVTELSDTNESAVVNTRGSTQSRCQKVYIESGFNKKLLLAMCIGLTTLDADGKTRKLANLSEEPFASAKDKKSFKFTNEMLCNEVIRRATIRIEDNRSTKMPRPSAWPTDILNRYLMEYPNNKPEDAAFLKAEEKKLVDALSSSAANSDKVAAAANTSTTTTTPTTSRIVFNWLADLRVIHVLIHDTVKAAYLNRHNACDRGQLDGRNSPYRPKNWNEVAAELYNSTSFSPLTLVLPDLHEDFAAGHDLAFASVPGPCTAQQMASWMTDRRSKLMKIIAKYERSGNGHGNRTESADASEDIEEDFQHKDDDRKDYLAENRSSILYFWEVADRFDILKSTMSELNSEQMATTENIPMASRPNAINKEKKRKATDKSNDALSRIGNGIESIASSSNVDSLVQVIRSCETSLEMLFAKSEEAVPGSARFRFYEKRIQENTQTMEKAQATLNSKL